MATGAVRAELAVVDIVGAVAVAATHARAAHYGKWLPVACIARGIGVRPGQRKIRLPVVIELPCPPVHRVVARCAVIAITVRMRIVCGVAIDAGVRCIPERVRLMTGVAGGIDVLAEQRKTGQVVIEEDIALPGRVVVAVLAGDAQLTLVRVFLGMAIAAARRECDLENRFDMTGFAGDGRMRAVQGVHGIARMIKPNGGPSRRRVTARTLRAEMPAMFIVVPVAGQASRVELVGKRIARMAVAAGQLAVAPIERE